jgi:hypothetical protein
MTNREQCREYISEDGLVIKTNWKLNDYKDAVVLTNLGLGAYGGIAAAIAGGILLGPVGVIGGFFGVSIISSIGTGIGLNVVQNWKHNGLQCSCGSQFYKDKIGMCRKHQQVYIHMRRNSLPADIRRLICRTVVCLGQP